VDAGDVESGDRDWVIVGGESGSDARPIREEWIDAIRLACEKSNVPFFFKQWSGRDIQRKGNVLHGRVFQEYPQLAEPCKLNEGLFSEM